METVFQDLGVGALAKIRSSAVPAARGPSATTAHLVKLSHLAHYTLSLHGINPLPLQSLITVELLANTRVASRKILV